MNIVCTKIHIITQDLSRKYPSILDILITSLCSFDVILQLIKGDIYCICMNTLLWGYSGGSERS